MPPVGFNVARAGRRLGGGLIQTTAGVAILSGLGQLFSPRSDMEIIKAEDINGGLGVEKNTNLLEIKFETGATIGLSLLVLGCLCLCAKNILCAKCIHCGKFGKCFRKKKEEKEGKEPENQLNSQEFELEDI